VGQLLALFVILIVMGYWRRSPNFMRQANIANIVMVFLGLRRLARKTKNAN